MHSWLNVGHSLKLPLPLLWTPGRWGSPHWRCTAEDKPSPVPCTFGGRTGSWLPGKWMHNGHFPPSAGVGYQPDVILWHSSLWPASRGSCQHHAWEIQATAQCGRSVNAKTGLSQDCSRACLPLLLPSHTSSSTVRQSDANQLNSYGKEGKEHNCYFGSLLLWGVGGAWLQLQKEICWIPREMLQGVGSSEQGLRKAEETQLNTHAQDSFWGSPGEIEPRHFHAVTIQSPMGSM